MPNADHAKHPIAQHTRDRPPPNTPHQPPSRHPFPYGRVEDSDAAGMLQPTKAPDPRPEPCFVPVVSRPGHGCAVRLPCVDPTPAIASRPPTALPQPVGWHVSIPNALTTARLFLAVGLIIQLSLWRYPKLAQDVAPPTGAMLLACLLFALGALTDLLDGMLARRWGIVSKYGRIMDPFADKILVVGAFAMLAGPAFDVTLPNGQPFQISGVMPWMAIVILSRELLVTLIRAVLESRGIDFSASLSGKVKMAAQCACVLTIFLTLAFFPATPGTPSRAVIDTMVWTAVIFTAASIVPYALRAMQATAAGR